MSEIIKPRKPEIEPRISLGQNFLSDENLLEALVSDAGVGPQSQVLEIGAGTGNLTQVLARRAKQVLSLEIDQRLRPGLERRFAETSNVRLVWADALEADLETLIAQYLSQPVQVVANLPYYITTPLVLRLLAVRPCFASLAVMVQWEVGEKMMAAPGEKQYGPLAVLSQYQCRVSVARRVPATAFHPPPKVESAFMLLETYAQKPIAARDEEVFHRVVRAAFAMRRKTLLNNLMAGFSLTRERAAALIQDAGLSQTVRGEALSIADFTRLADALSGDKVMP